jgi:hypothetical protein
MLGSSRSLAQDERKTGGNRKTVSLRRDFPAPNVSHNDEDNPEGENR